MNNLKFKKIALLLVLSITVVFPIQSQILTGSAIISAAVVQKEGDRYQASVTNSNPATRSFYVERSYGLIMLSSSNLYQLSTLSGSASITVQIEYEVESAGGFYSPAPVTQKLELSALGNKVVDAAYFKAEGAQKIKATIISTTIPATWASANLKFEASVVTESFDFLNFNAIPSTGLNLHHATPLTQSGNLLVSWASITGAQAYDLEWTYVSDQGINGRLDPSDIKVDRFLFRNNSSRIEVEGTSYEIPLMYEQGYIVYRLRAAGKRLANGVVTKAFTEWSTPDGLYGILNLYPSANLYPYDGLEKNINWQSSLTFAEEGKHKAVVAFHDGSMRNRQAVTRINTDQRSVVGETFYDYNGKPVIQVLPVPTTQNALNYYPNFNIIEGETKLEKEDYTSLHQVNGAGCVVTSPDLSTTSGASNYYSSQNLFTNSTTDNTGTNMINRNSVPDANKKPYTQTQYKADNTGKIAAQSGVGSTHILGSDHETKYLYGNPQQEELTRLFGNQVGYNVHYKKDVTVDANGQVSVTYKNMGDKVIATTITGSAPPNLTELDGDKTKEINSDLLGISGSANQLSKDKTSKTLSTTITAPTNNQYTFDYSAILGSYNLTCITPNTSSTDFNGAVDLTIQLIDGCGSVVFTSNDPASGDVIKTDGSNQSLSFERDNVNLKQGDYNLTKTVTINEEKLEEYWENYLASDNNCFKDTLVFRNEEKARLDLIGCDLTCEKCEAQMTIMINSGNYSTEEQAQIAHLCDEICDKEIGCTNYIYSMQGDMSPGGQYAELRKSKLNITSSTSTSYDSDGNPVIEHPDVTFDKAGSDNPAGDAGDPADNTIDTVSFPLSIFSYFNSLPINELIQISGIRAHWRYPLQISDNSRFSGDNSKNQILFANVGLGQASYSITDYKDENGNIVYAYVFGDANDPNKYTPGVMNTSSDILVLQDAQTLLYKIPIRYLTNVADFEKYWKPHFANYLLPYHPEYGYLVECTETYRLSNDFDYNVSNTDNYLDARNDEYISSGTGGQPIIIGETMGASKDPFLIGSSGNYKYMKKISDEFKPGKSMAAYATSMVNCTSYPAASTCTVTAGICDDGVVDTDDEWNVYKGLYISEKQKLIKYESMKKAVDHFYYNGCIGEPDFYSMPEAYYFRDKEIPITTSVTKHLCFFSWQSPTFFDRGCVDIPVTYSISIHPYIDPRQVCYSNRANLFEKKTKRFFVTFSANSPAGQIPSNCENVSQDGDDEIVVPIPCDDALTEFSDQQTMEAQRYKYESCGLCPFASDVETFLIGMLDSNNIESPTPKHLTCVNDGVLLGEQLYSQLFNLNSDNDNISWETTLTSNDLDSSKTLEGKFISATNTIATLRLVIPPYKVPSYVQFKDLNKLCCMTVTKGISGTDAGKLFTMEAQYTNLKNKKVNFTVEGYFDLRLDICELTPRCVTTDDSRRVANFLNMLVVTGESKSSDLVTTGSSVSLLGVTDLKDDYYMDVTRAVIKKDNELEYGGYADNSTLESYSPQWSSTVVSNTFQGSLDYTIGSDHKTLVIELSCASTIDFTQIIEFSRIRPYSGDVTKFYVDALVSRGSKPSENVYKTIEITAPSLQPTVCEELHVPDPK